MKIFTSKTLATLFLGVAAIGAQAQLAWNPEDWTQTRANVTMTVDGTALKAVQTSTDNSNRFDIFNNVALSLDPAKAYLVMKIELDGFTGINGSDRKVQFMHQINNSSTNASVTDYEGYNNFNIQNYTSTMCSSGTSYYFAWEVKEKIEGQISGQNPETFTSPITFTKTADVWDSNYPADGYKSRSWIKFTYIFKDENSAENPSVKFDYIAQATADDIQISGKVDNDKLMSYIDNEISKLSSTGDEPETPSDTKSWTATDWKCTNATATINNNKMLLSNFTTGGNNPYRFDLVNNTDMTLTTDDKYFVAKVKLDGLNFGSTNRKLQVMHQINDGSYTALSFNVQNFEASVAVYDETTNEYYFVWKIKEKIESTLGDNVSAWTKDLYFPTWIKDGTYKQTVYDESDVTSRRYIKFTMIPTLMDNSTDGNVEVDYIATASASAIEDVSGTIDKDLVVKYINAQITDNGTTGISNTIVDTDENAPIEYYNLQGIKIVQESLPTGIYIRRQGNKVAKILVR